MPADLDALWDASDGDDWVPVRDDELIVDEEARPPQSSFVELRSGGVAGGTVDDVLECIDFFLEQGLVAAARAMLVDALARMPTHPLLRERIGVIDAAIVEEALRDDPDDTTPRAVPGVGAAR